MANGSLYFQFVEKIIAMVSVESPASTVAKSARESRVTFMDQLGTIWDTLDLFTGMSLLIMIESLSLLRVASTHLWRLKNVLIWSILKVTQPPQRLKN